MPSTSPAAPVGWYPDPDDATQERLWDGTVWTDNRRPVVATAALAPIGEPTATPQSASAPPLPVEPLAVSVEGSTPALYPAAPSAPISSQQMPLPHNRSAAVGMWLGVVAVLVAGLFGILGTLAIIFSIIGLVHSSGLKKQTGVPVGRSRSIWGIILGAVSLIATIIVIASIAASSGVHYSKSIVQNDILKNANKTTTILTKVTCPPDAGFSEGDTFHCLGTVKGGGTVVFDVHVEDNKGYIVWSVER